MSKSILTRMGDGERVRMEPAELKEELQQGTQNAAALARIPELSAAEIDHLYDIIAEPGRVVSVPHGHELIVTDDGIADSFGASEADGGNGVQISTQSAILSYERGLAADTASLGHADYSFKPVKAILDVEQQSYHTISMLTTVPLFYGSQPNTGDPFGMPVTHIVTAGMGGMRTAGDLVAWMQMSRRMKLADAKQVVAEKLKVDVADLVDEDVMYPLRQELGIGVVSPEAGGPEGILAKCRIAELLDIEINSVNRFKSQLM